MYNMNKIERLEAAIAGKEVDRVPYSIWYHLSAVDQDPVSLAEETVALSKKYDYDFVKMMPFGLYGVQDLGAQIDIFAALYSRRTEPYVADAIIYWLLCVVLTFVFNSWERRLSKGLRPADN